MGCECITSSNNKSELVMNDLNLDLNNKNIIQHSNSGTNSGNYKASNIISPNNYNQKLMDFDCMIGKDSKKDLSIIKGSSTDMNSGQPIQKTITIFTFNKIELFKKRLLKELNNARTEPQKFIPKIKKLMENIHHTSNGLCLKVDHKINIKLLSGRRAFLSCLHFLEKQKVLQPLFLKEEIALEFPYDNPEICDDPNYLTQILDKKKMELKNDDLKIVNFHYDLIIPNPELSVLMQLVDDTNSKYQRRLNIFNEEAKYIGISIGKKANGVICFYLLFANDLQ